MWIHALLGALCLSLALASPPGNRSDVSDLIYGGTIQNVPFPQLMTIFHYRFGYQCGASLLTQRYVLTAAHCLANVTPDQITVVAGLAWLDDTSLPPPLVQASKVTRITIHPDYKGNQDAQQGNDIAILQLETPFTFTNKIKPVQITSNDWQTEQPRAPVSVFGFGPTKLPFDPQERNKNLLRADTTIYDRGDCSFVYEQFFQQTLNYQFLCTDADQRGVLSGDSGGPLISFRDGVAWQVGVVKGGHYEYRLPSLYMRTAVYCPWIEKTTKHTFLCTTTDAKMS